MPAHLQPSATGSGQQGHEDGGSAARICDALARSGGASTLGDVADALGDDGLAILLLAAAAPALAPAPPGFGLVAGALPLWLGWRMAAGDRAPRLPSVLARRAVRQESWERIVDAARPFLRRAELLGRERLAVLTRGQFRRALGIAVMLFALSIAVPLPLSNTLPAAGIVLIAIAMSTDDGVLAIGGVLVGVAGVVLTLSLSAGAAGLLGVAIA